MTITELDSLRADTMRYLLDDEGRRCIWKYDVCERKHAIADAAYDQNYDNLMTGLSTKKPYALIGPGICDHYFETPDELIGLVRWLCVDGYLSCYWAKGC